MGREMSTEGDRRVSVCVCLFACLTINHLTSHLPYDARFILCCEYNYGNDHVRSLQWFDCLSTKNDVPPRSPFACPSLSLASPADTASNSATTLSSSFLRSL
jgi:hypothetical protein